MQRRAPNRTTGFESNEPAERTSLAKMAEETKRIEVHLFLELQSNNAPLRSIATRGGASEFEESMGRIDECRDKRVIVSRKRFDQIFESTSFVAMALHAIINKTERYEGWSILQKVPAAKPRVSVSVSPAPSSSSSSSLLSETCSFSQGPSHGRNERTRDDARGSTSSTVEKRRRFDDADSDVPFAFEGNEDREDAPVAVPSELLGQVHYVPVTIAKSTLEEYNKAVPALEVVAEILKRGNDHRAARGLTSEQKLEAILLANYLGIKIADK